MGAVVALFILLLVCLAFFAADGGIYLTLLNVAFDPIELIVDVRVSMVQHTQLKFNQFISLNENENDK